MVGGGIGGDAWSSAEVSSASSSLVRGARAADMSSPRPMRLFMAFWVAASRIQVFIAAQLLGMEVENLLLRQAGVLTVWVFFGFGRVVVADRVGEIGVVEVVEDRSLTIAIFCFDNGVPASSSTAPFILVAAFRSMNASIALQSSAVVAENVWHSSSGFRLSVKGTSDAGRRAAEETGSGLSIFWKGISSFVSCAAETL